ncbi:hypothetical protein RF11_02688 [Thelohanellus kitauei]|uniref:Uncharacterized protein n=1 Tax=Thelohanellus kitauei TaxID=669202 RepID=A0A0C2IIU9_THEKT|nr:hypothetical protein RF11_02688 [Thelohanellus kitauei]
MYESITRIFCLCLFIVDVRHLFLQKFECYPTYGEKSLNIVSTLLHVFERYSTNQCWMNFLPFKTFQNLFMRYFSSFEGFKNYISGGTKPQNTCPIYVCLKADSEELFQELRQNSFLMHILSTFSSARTTRFPIKDAIYALRCLMIINCDQNISEFISDTLYDFDQEFNKYLITLFCQDSANIHFQDLIGVSKIIRKRLYPSNMVSKPLDHRSDQPNQDSVENIKGFYFVIY